MQDDEYDDDDDLLDDVVPDVFAPYLPSAESPPATAVNNKKCGYRLSDILDSIDESEENRARIHKFGVVRSLLTGDIVRTPTNQGGVYVASASLAPYLHRLYGSGAPTKQEICDRLFTAPSGFKYGTSYKFKPKADTWAIFWEPQKLMELTTLEISSVICAALNSRRRLHWVIGIGRGLKILGCSVMTQERDTLRQALDYTIRVNISPCLDPNLVHMDFIPVEGQEVDENEMRALITITIDVRVTTFYQLTSGRIFYVSKNELKEIEGGIDEARRMMQLRKSKDHISLVDQDPVYGHFRYTLSKDCHIHPFLLLMTKNVIYFVSGIAAGLIARYALSKVFI
ncbi:hypothetical protein OESDEN_00974 [Oesophagostomum dentatum]|uniref:Uncharacterized protein n=1 Tax=Oesophagostomum dentatum TaxID=61180 RepID=A0A0B1TP57_OESDE|nr:hypothetical protein OESDEN_00974 [Oesophagostomum dentatum]